MKKFLRTLAAIALLATPVAAEARHRDNDRSDHRSERRSGGCGWLCGAIIGGVVVGALSSNNRDRQDDTYNEPRYRDRDNYRPRRVCFEEQIVEYRFGRKYVYYEYRCR